MSIACKQGTTISQFFYFLVWQHSPLKKVTSRDNFLSVQSLDEKISEPFTKHTQSLPASHYFTEPMSPLPQNDEAAAFTRDASFSSSRCQGGVSSSWAAQNSLW